MKKAVLIIISVLLSLFFFWFFLFKNRNENRLMSLGNEIVEKVEDYRIKYKKLPNSLNEIGIQIVDENNPPLYYEKKNDANYVIWFATSSEDIKTYYSDTKKWENYQKFE